MVGYGLDCQTGFVTTSSYWNKHHLVFSQKALLIDDLYLSTEYSGSTEKLQNNALKM